MAFIPHTERDVAEMLGAIGASSIEQLFDEIPANLRVKSLAGVPAAMNEMEIGRLMSERAKQDGRPLLFSRRRRLRASHSGSRMGDHHAR